MTMCQPSEKAICVRAAARSAGEAGFTALSISDHYHPWVDAQGQSPFVWSMIGALSQVTRLPITTAVTCPTVRIHPAIVAQAAVPRRRGRRQAGAGGVQGLLCGLGGRGRADRIREVAKLRPAR